MPELREETPHRFDLSELRSHIEMVLDQAAREKEAILAEAGAPSLDEKSIESHFGELLDVVSATSIRFEPEVYFRDIGTVLHIGDGVATLSGLPRGQIEELMVFPTGVLGLIFSLDRVHVNVILLGPDQSIQGGDQVDATGERLQVPVGPSLLGRVVNALGEPLDDRGALQPSGSRYLDQEAPGIIDRQPVSVPLHTGLKVIDALLPIGRGQRELILGDRQTGKTTIAVDAIMNQRDEDVPCIYVSIGQKKSSALRVIDRLRETGSLAHTTIVLASPDDPPALRYLAPFAGCTMAEYFLEQGRDVLIIYDDLKRHADAYRELSLLLRRPPGREAYPGDIFYLHSRLLERACKLSEENGGGSITALPIIETQRGNIAAYIPTNLISITDGQIVLDTDLFNKGVKPSVDVGKSVSRVGGKAQTEIMRMLAGELRLQLAQYHEVERFARFGTDIDEATQRQIERGERLQAILTQPPHTPMKLWEQAVVLMAAREELLEGIPIRRLPAFERKLLVEIERHHLELVEQIQLTGELNDEDHQILLHTIEEVHRQWIERTTQQ
ncbi:MAG: F0F1 ATP synthase subunit alpha [Anaerolineales bacterium]|nr:F0F1 ATP synthase subunit alpha [Anaerolineales bacterium]